MVNMIQLQMGKKGLTPEFIKDLKVKFEKVENIRVSLLKSSTRDKEELKKITDEILAKLGPKFTAKVIGFKIILKKWRKARTK